MCIFKINLIFFSKKKIRSIYFQNSVQNKLIKIESSPSLLRRRRTDSNQPVTGFEPATPRLQAGCATNYATRAYVKITRKKIVKTLLCTFFRSACMHACIAVSASRQRAPGRRVNNENIELKTVIDKKDILQPQF